MAAAFANYQDVAARWRPLTTAEESVADVLAMDASALIRARFPGIDAQVANGSVDADVLTMVVAGMVRRAMIAPLEGVSQDSETVGPYSHSQTFANPMRNVYLSDTDLTLILGFRPAVFSGKYGNTTFNSPGCW